MVCSHKDKTFYGASPNKGSLYAMVMQSVDDWVSSNSFSSHAINGYGLEYHQECDEQEYGQWRKLVWLWAGVSSAEVEFGCKLEWRLQKRRQARLQAHSFQAWIKPQLSRIVSKCESSAERLIQGRSQGNRPGHTKVRLHFDSRPNGHWALLVLVSGCLYIIGRGSIQSGLSEEKFTVTKDWKSFFKI